MLNDHSAGEGVSKPYNEPDACEVEVADIHATEPLCRFSETLIATVKIEAVC